MQPFSLKHTTFFFISLFFLLVAFFHGPLYVVFPNIFEPVHKFITDVGSTILYVAGFTALFIAIFAWLPTWASLILFGTLVFSGGIYLQDKAVSIQRDNGNFHLAIVKRAVTTPLSPSSTTPLPSSKTPSESPSEGEKKDK